MKQGVSFPMFIATIAVAFITLALIFQLFFRYEYLGAQRIDRLTQQRCIYVPGYDGYGPPC